jgi:hypothetical protein
LAKSKAPTLAEVKDILLDLVTGRCSRAEAAEWASPWIRLEDPPDMDQGLWEAIGRISGADALAIDHEFLYDERDFASWLSDLTNAG